MICHFCGNQHNPAHARFCAHCGTALLVPEQQMVPPRVETEPQPSVPPPAEGSAASAAVTDPDPPAVNEGVPPRGATPDPVPTTESATPAPPGLPLVMAGGAHAAGSNEQAPQASASEAPRSAESRYWAVGAHVSALVGVFMGGVPIFLGPLVVWLLRRDRDEYAAAHGRNALNFNLSVLLYAVGLVLCSIITFGFGLLIAIPGFLVLGVLWLVLTIVGMVKAACDEPWRYPLAIRFIKG